MCVSVLTLDALLLGDMKWLSGQGLEVLVWEKTHFVRQSEVNNSSVIDPVSLESGSAPFHHRSFIPC